MSETLFAYHTPIRSQDGRMYHARACGAPLDATVWEGWIEFDALDGSDDTLRSPRETTQPNRADAEYWASGLSEIYLEGSLKRAMDGPIEVPVAPVRPAVFSEPAPSTVAVPANGPTARSVLDPFSVYEKGEALLRNQLAALSAWHLVNIILDYELSDAPVGMLNASLAPVLIDIIVRGVKQSAAAQ